MIEVILLDPRYFSRTEPSFADPSKPTCLNGVQWQWFKKTIKASDATFKIVMSAWSGTTRTTVSPMNVGAQPLTPDNTLMDLHQQV